MKFYFTWYHYRVIRRKNIVIVIFTYTILKVRPRYYTLQFNRVICAVANFIYRKRIHQGSESEAVIGSWRRMLFRSVRLLRPLYFRALCQQTNGSFSIPYMYVHFTPRLWINASAIQRTTWKSTAKHFFTRLPNFLQWFSPTGSDILSISRFKQREKESSYHASCINVWNFYKICIFYKKNSRSLSPLIQQTLLYLVVSRKQCSKCQLLRTKL